MNIWSDNYGQAWTYLSYSPVSFKLFDEVPKKKWSAQNFSKKKVSQVKEFNDLLSNELNSREADFWFHCKKNISFSAKCSFVYGLMAGTATGIVVTVLAYMVTKVILR